MPTFNEELEFIKSIISRSLLDDAIEWIKSNLRPDEVFNERDLEEWAESNSYIKKFEE